MASGSRQKTTMAKLNRERKQARKDERKRAAAGEALLPAGTPEAAELHDAPLAAGGELRDPMA